MLAQRAPLPRGRVLKTPSIPTLSQTPHVREAAASSHEGPPLQAVWKGVDGSLQVCQAGLQKWAGAREGSLLAPESGTEGEPSGEPWRWGCRSLWALFSGSAQIWRKPVQKGQLTSQLASKTAAGLEPAALDPYYAGPSTRNPRCAGSSPDVPHQGHTHTHCARDVGTERGMAGQCPLLLSEDTES